MAPKRTRHVAEAEAVLATAEPETPKRRGRKPATTAAASLTSSDPVEPLSDAVVEPATPSRRSTRRTGKASSSDVGSESETEPAPAVPLTPSRRGRRPAKVAAEEEKELPPLVPAAAPIAPAAAKPKRGAKKQKTQEPEANDEDDGAAVAPEPPVLLPSRSSKTAFNVVAASITPVQTLSSSPTKPTAAPSQQPQPEPAVAEAIAKAVSEANAVIADNQKPKKPTEIRGMPVSGRPWKPVHKPYVICSWFSSLF